MMNKSNTKELKKLVKEFRYHELRTLLTFAKRNNAGRKVELLDKVNNLIDNGCSISLAIKIQDLSRKRGANKVATTTSIPQATNNSGSITNNNSVLPTLQNNNHGKKNADKCNKQLSNQPTASDNNYTSTFSNGPSTSSNLLNNGIINASGSVDVPFLPDVKFRSLPFYDLCDDLLKPTGMRDSSFGSRFNPKFAKYEFFLTPQQTKMVKDSQVTIDDCMIDYGVQVLLRYCLLETTVEQDDNLPPKLCVHVNSKLITLPPFITPSHMGIEPKRPSRPLDITHACELSPTKPNVISMTWVSDPLHNHCLSVVLCKKLNCSILLFRLKQNCTRHSDFTRALIKEKLATNSDNEISFTCLKISLICPLGKVRLTTPCRSTGCNHLQCFDASTYLQMNDKKPTWVCPICDKPARYDSLIIDGLFIEILSQVKDTNEIQFLEDGNWKPIIKKQQNENVVFENSVVCYEVPDSPNSSDTVSLKNEKLDNVSEVVAKNKKNKDKSKNITMIDLTGDSDEDDSDDNNSNDANSIDFRSYYNNDNNNYINNDDTSEGAPKAKKKKKKFSKNNFMTNFEQSSSLLEDVVQGLDCPSVASALLFSNALPLPELDFPGSFSPIIHSSDDGLNPPDLIPF